MAADKFASKEMLPTLAGTIRRRLLVNFRADPQVAQSPIPTPLRVLEHKGSAIVGICLIRLEHIRPTGFPEAVGICSENMAHRIAVNYDDEDNVEREGVYIWRRHSDNPLNTLAGGRLFPGVHSPATFTVHEEAKPPSFQPKPPTMLPMSMSKAQKNKAPASFHPRPSTILNRLKTFLPAGPADFPALPMAKHLKACS